MFVQVITAQVRPDQLGEIERVFRMANDGQRAQPDGWPAHWLLLDREACKCLALTVWNSEAELRAGEPLGRMPFAALVMHTFAGTPTREVFELVA